MRKHCLQLLQLVLLTGGVLLAASCSKGYESPLGGRTIEDMTLPSALSSQTVDFGGWDMTKVWAETSDEGWCTAYVRGQEFIVNVMENRTYDARTATVDVYDSESGDHLTFRVTQLQNDAILPEVATYEVPAEGGTVAINLQTNLGQHQTVAHADWIHVVPADATRGLVETTDYVTVDANEGADPREGYVEFVSLDGGFTTSVLLRQQAVPYIRLSDQVVSIGAEGGELSVGVESNFDYRVEVESMQTWVQAGTKTATGANQYAQRLQVSALPSGTDYRRCIVYFVKPDLSVNQILTVVQQREQ